MITLSLGRYTSVPGSTDPTTSGSRWPFALLPESLREAPVPEQRRRLCGRWPFLTSTKSARFGGDRGLGSFPHVKRCSVLLSSFLCRIVAVCASPKTPHSRKGRHRKPGSFNRTHQGVWFFRYIAVVDFVEVAALCAE